MYNRCCPTFTLIWNVCALSEMLSGFVKCWNVFSETLLFGKWVSFENVFSEMLCFEPQGHHRGQCNESFHFTAAEPCDCTVVDWDFKKARTGIINGIRGNHTGVVTTADVTQIRELSEKSEFPCHDKNWKVGVTAVNNYNCIMTNVALTPSPLAVNEVQ